MGQRSRERGGAEVPRELVVYGGTLLNPSFSLMSKAVCGVIGGEFLHSVGLLHASFGPALEICVVRTLLAASRQPDAGGQRASAAPG
jgi:hypothetical protein